MCDFQTVRNQPEEDIHGHRLHTMAVLINFPTYRDYECTMILFLFKIHLGIGEGCWKLQEDCCRNYFLLKPYRKPLRTETESEIS